MATRAAHRRLDHHPLLQPLLQPGLSLTHYGWVLQGFHAVYSGLQAALGTALAQIDGDYPLADRLAWLQEDLACLASTDVHMAAVVQPAMACQISDTPSLIGALYVVEGSSLGGQMITRQLRASLGLDAAHGARFFSGRAEATPQHWQDFWRFANTHCPAQAQAAAATAAVALFDAIALTLDTTWACYLQTNTLTASGQ